MAKKQNSRVHSTSKGGLGGRFIFGGKIARSPLDKFEDKWKAYKAGKKAYVTIPNPNPLETNKRWIRMEMRTVYGDPRNR